MTLPPYLKFGVIVLYNIPKSKGEVSAAWSAADAGILAEVEAVEKALAELSIPARRAGIRGLDELNNVLAAGPERVVFNLVEELRGPAHDVNFVPALCRSLGKAVTGNNSVALMQCLDKTLAKAALAAAGVPTPAAVAAPMGVKLADLPIPPGRLIVKPMATDASEGITPDGVVDGPGPKLAAAVARVHEQFRQPALIEQFIAGREINVSVIQVDGALEVLPLAEIDFSAFAPGKLRIVDYAAKWQADSFEFNNTPRVIPAPLSEAPAAKIREMARSAWRALSCQGYARVDFRVSEAGEPLVLEINPNPDIAPDAGFAAAVAASGMSFSAWVLLMLKTAEYNYQQAQLINPKSQILNSKQSIPNLNQTKINPNQSQNPKSKIEIRWSEPADREAIVEFTKATKFFRPDEVEIAREVLDDSLRDGPQGDYQSYTALVNLNGDDLDFQSKIQNPKSKIANSQSAIRNPQSKPVGWVCFGETPCTIGTYDVYWIVVDPACQGQGVGRALMEVAEKAIAARGGRLAVVETSSRADYDPTRMFYLRIGYTQAAFLPDFYAQGDGKLIYIKNLAT